ncbi:retropepsin-like aspartic protease [Danxiaibacter flavus]|uniref:Retropepsin-like aspartic protease n=1 Tax=Danxiaibacter flavus TaxID=3049108 RepID=A0ABV3Z8C4_9BACT|nr:retropepsin-like aspartic protease [Chitinophagaceae bacterium DXS]
MHKHSVLLWGMMVLFSLNLPAQSLYVKTKEGKPILNRKQLIGSCLRSLHKDNSNQAAVAACNCQVDKLDRRFSAKQYKSFTKNGIVDLPGLLKEDPAVEKDIQECLTSTGQSMLLQADGFEEEFVKGCMENIQATTEKSLNPQRVEKFCRCQLDLIKTNKLTDAEIKTLENPNSMLFYEVMYKCGDPFQTENEEEKNWTSRARNDVKGPLADSVNVLNLGGMSFIKIKMGDETLVWLLDTGASDMLINKDMEEKLKKENMLSNYIGTGEYEMANGAVDTCRKYRLNNIQVGNYSIDNVVVAVTEKGKKIIAGKALLNKFANWELNNQKGLLILTK